MLLSVESGAFAYRGGPRLFSGLSFTLSPGEILAVLGPNGAGKTTLLRAVTGMLPWTEGRTLLDGEDIRAIPPRTLWRRIAYVPQARTAASPFTVLESVLLGRCGHIPLFGSPRPEDAARAEEVLDALSLSHLREKKCTQISGGEMQMVLIARALAADPAVLILDEPESNLDFRNQLLVLDTVTRLAREGIACLFNTHYPDHALQRADRAILLHHGTAAVGEAAEIVTEENIARAFGVRAVVGGMETGETTVPHVQPLSVVSPNEPEEEATGTALAALTVISDTADAAEAINECLHEYGDMILGRMGMPVRSRGVWIIHVNADGDRARIRALLLRLSRIPGVRVKAVWGPQ